MSGACNNHRVLRLVAGLCLAASVGACDDYYDSRITSHGVASTVGACPRPQMAVGLQPRLNDQQREVRALRQRAFRDDFFAQLELGRRYLGERASDRNLEDPVEAATWYALALSNSGGYEPLGGVRPDRHLPDRLRTVARFDDCRAFERAEARHTLDKLLARMDDGDWDKVRNRVTYVLASQGAPGFLTLARLHDAAFGPFGEPLDGDDQGPGFFHRDPAGPQPPPPPATLLFPRNDMDVYLYDELAAQTGDVGAYVLMHDMERPSRQRSGYASVVNAKVNRWVAPYEFYPPDSPSSGVPHSDESPSRGETVDVALSRIDALPFVHVSEALAFLGVIPKLPPQWLPPRGYLIPPNDVQTFQAMLGREQTGRLTPLEKVRAIQYAATNGSARSQLVLAVMYTEGVGVPADYARAFYWFDKAAKQGSPEAKYAISTYFSLGLAGVADQDKAKAVVYQINAALSGFQPSADRLQAILSRAYGPPSDFGGPHDPAERTPW